MSTKTDNFINAIAPLAVNEYLSREKWILPSVCIAQAALESGWNLEAKSVFGIKGEGFKATTTEYYNGNKTIIEDSFRAYPDLASSVVGYYDFLRDTPRYEKALNNTDYKDTVDKLIYTTDGYPYATAPNYIETVISIIEDFDLTRFDEREEKEVSIEDIILEMKKKGFEVKTNNENELYFVKPMPATTEAIKKGDKVTVVNAINYDDGQPFEKWYEKYDVLEVDGNRAVIGIGDVTTSAIDVKNIKKV